ncbi:IS5 family transposase [Mesorhizobium sp. M0244]|uniref:IS5 family transposase n=1 Tax=Mesorhizobium sp. M0244 TaxID=2956926 RepID=UPI0033379551
MSHGLQREATDESRLFLADGGSRFRGRRRCCQPTRAASQEYDRRAIGGIVHVLKSGGRWVDAPQVYGPRKTLYNRFVRWAAKGVWVDIFHALASAGGPPAEVLIDLFGREGASLRFWRHRGEQNQAIGRSRGGRTTKIHALTDGLCRPIAFLLTGGQVSDCSAGDLLLEQMPKSPILHADKDYDTNAIRHRSRLKRRCRTFRRSQPALEELLLPVPLP